MWWIILAGVLVLGAALWGPIVSNVEQPKYKVFATEKNIQIRDYAPIIVAETQVTGGRDKAINEGFRIIADYIFGNNLSSKKVAMTAPVTQQASEKVAMTAPVTQQGGGKFVAGPICHACQLHVGNASEAKNPAVQLKEIKGKRFAVIRFSGLAREESLKRHTDELKEFVKAKDLNALSAATYAFYNPPWTLPFLRRNEVMIEVAR